jgi:hypothetical protein
MKFKKDKTTLKEKAKGFELDRLERLNRGIDPERALMYLGKETVETAGEGEWVLGRTGRTDYEATSRLLTGIINGITSGSPANTGRMAGMKGKEHLLVKNFPG